MRKIIGWTAISFKFGTEFAIHYIVIKNNNTMAKRFKWVAFSHDWSYEVGSHSTFVTKDACYNDMRTAVLNKMRWNTEYNEDFEDGTSAISYKVWFERGMIVHQSYSGTYVYLIVNEDENPDYYEVFNEEMVKHLQNIDMIDWAGVNTIESYQKRHKEQLEREKKKSYEVTIRTTNTRTYSVIAESEEDAIQKAYNNINDYDSEEMAEDIDATEVNDIK